MSEGFARRAQPAPTPQDEIFETLLRATRALLRRPLLANAMIQSTSTAKVTTIPDVARVDRQFRDVLFEAAGLEQVTENDSVLVRYWYRRGSASSSPASTAGSRSPDAEEDLRTACRLLLADLSNAQLTADPGINEMNSNSGPVSSSRGRVVVGRPGAGPGGGPARQCVNGLLIELNVRLAQCSPSVRSSSRAAIALTAKVEYIPKMNELQSRTGPTRSLRTYSQYS